MKGNLSKHRNSIGNVYKKTEADRLFENSKSELKKYVDSAAGGKVDKVDGKGLSTNDYSDSDKAEVAKIKNKVDKVSGKGLSANDYSDSDKAEVAKVKNKVDKVSGKGLSANDYSDSDKAEVAKVKNKVDKVSGKGLSANDYTAEDKAKVSKAVILGDQLVEEDNKSISLHDEIYINAHGTSGCNAVYGVDGVKMRRNGNAQFAVEYISAGEGEPPYYEVETLRKGITHKLTEKANQAEVDKKVDKVEGKSLINKILADNVEIGKPETDVYVVQLSDKIKYFDLLNAGGQISVKGGLFVGTPAEYVNMSNGHIGCYGGIDSYGGAIVEHLDDGVTVHKLAEKADASAVLTKDNTTEFTPTSDYQPATKKYVDDSVKAVGSLSNLTTTEKTSIVAAINELKAAIDALKGS